ncbi:MAG TPA: hypothetical protein VKQ72_08215, partial [Aggregatilineales bacterium]|nr:hypothetical protein [Aggregatilineales bacterium]
MTLLFAPAVRLMNRLKYSQKYLLVGLVLVIPLGVVLTQYISQSNATLDFAAKELSGLAYNGPLTTFLHDVEQYAGLVYIHAEGDDALKARMASAMADQQAKVEDDMRAVDAAQASMGQTVAIGTRWDDLKNEWNRVKIALPTLTEGTAASLYSNLIHQTVVLIVVVGNNSNLILDHDIDTYYIMESLVQEIPESSSYLSDIRNYSAASAAAGTLSSADRTRLVILGGLARFELESQQMSLGYVAAYNPSLTTFLNDNLSAVQIRLNEFLDHVDKVILGSAGEQQT